MENSSANTQEYPTKTGVILVQRHYTGKKTLKDLIKEYLLHKSGSS